MRPLRIVMRAFGPYADQQIVDFSELAPHRRFLIHGPTGAGKSTILDAMCFALYGEASGDDRPSSMMRSDHADPARLSEVVMDFAIGPEQYRVSRIPEQERPKKRGTGTTLMRPTATLWRRTKAEGIEDEGELLAHQWTKVNHKIEEILGFRVDQFRQVVILPQGQFRRLLTARSAERQSIMETLFQTEVYRRIEDNLKADSRQVAKKLDALRAQRQIVLEQAGVSAEVDLEHMLLDAVEEVEELGRRRIRLDAASSIARKALAEGRAIQEALRQRDEREGVLLGLQRRIPELEVRRDSLTLARRAAAVVTTDELAIQSDLKAQDASTHRERLSEVAAEAERECALAERRLDEEQARSHERLDATQRLHELETLRDKVADLEEARRRQQEAEAALEGASQARLEAEADFEQKTKKLDGLRQQRGEASLEAARASDLIDALERAQGRLEARARLDEVEEALAEARDRLTRDEASLAESVEQLTQERQELVLIEGAWFGAQAAILAARLGVGDPCPVCGGTDHPKPATSEGALPSEATLQRKRKKIDALSKTHDEARATAEASRLEEIERRASAKALHETFGEAPPPLSDLQAHLDQLRASLSLAQAAGERLEALDTEIAGLEVACESALAHKRACDSLKDDAAGHTAKERAIVQEREAQIPKALRTPEALESSIDEVSRALEALRAALAEAERGARDTRERFAQAQAELDAAQGALEQARQQATESRALFEARLGEEGFEDEASYRASLHSEETIEALESEINTFDGQLQAAIQEAERAREIADGLQPPDMDALRLADEDARTAHEDALRRETALTERLSQMRERKALLGTLGDEIKGLDDRYAVVGRLSQVASGRNGLRMTFQRFVLTTLLDEVLECASRRLRVMSNRRYDLRRASGLTDARAAGGLELEVHDSYTGTQRNVITLSGGESFLAALSLALGLADVVQAYAGGIHIETIFVDEGFGSLDTEAMDLALRALMDLQEGGRMVGIISHVSELKERIHARLEVERGPKGSVARFRV